MKLVAPFRVAEATQGYRYSAKIQRVKGDFRWTSVTQMGVGVSSLPLLAAHVAVADGYSHAGLDCVRGL
jgi:hypothetical protein